MVPTLLSLTLPLWVLSIWDPPFWPLCLLTGMLCLQLIAAYQLSACQNCSQRLAIAFDCTAVALQSVQLLHCSLCSASIPVTAFPCFGQTVYSHRSLLTRQLVFTGWAVRCCLLRVASKCSSASLLWRVSWAAALTRSQVTSPRSLQPPFWPSSACTLLGLPGPGAPWGGWCPLSSTTLRPEEPGRPSPSASTSSSLSSSAKSTSLCSASKHSSCVLSLMFLSALVYVC